MSFDIMSAVRVSTAEHLPTVGSLLRAGNYHWIDKHVTDECFPTILTGSGTIELSVIGCHSFVPTLVLFTELRRNHFTLASARELLLLLTGAPQLPVSLFPIAGAGQTWRDSDRNDFAVCATMSEYRRSVGLLRIERVWNPKYRLVARYA
jgi:hypothetical protein